MGKIIERIRARQDETASRWTGFYSHTSKGWADEIAEMMAQAKKINEIVCARMARRAEEEGRPKTR